MILEIKNEEVFFLKSVLERRILDIEKNFKEFKKYPLMQSLYSTEKTLLDGLINQIQSEK